MYIPMKERKHHFNFPEFLVIMAVFAILAYSCEDLLGPDTGDDRDKLVDTWKVIDESEPLKSAQVNYWVEIEKDPDRQDMIRIYSFNYLGEDIYAMASLSGSTLTLAQQDLPGGWTVQGSGEIQKGWNEINWTYTVDDGSGMLERVTAVYTRIGL
jgi:hypothetical protein